MMKKTLRAIGKTCATSALVLLASRGPATADQVNDVPAQINATLNFDCNQNQSFLTAWKLLSGGASATTPNWAGANGSCAVPPALSGSGGIPASPTLLGPLNYNVIVQTWAGTWGGFNAFGFTSFNLNGSLTLQDLSGVNNGTESYVLEQKLFPPNASFGWDGVLPLDIDPYLPAYFPYSMIAGESAPAGNPMSLTEIPGLLSITLQCPNLGDPLPDFVPYSGRVEAVLNNINIPPELSPDNSGYYTCWGNGGTPTHRQHGPGEANSLQATLSPLTGNTFTWNGAAKLMVRSGRNYHLNIYYTTGHYWYSDAINWKIEVPNVPDTSGNANATVPACQTTAVPVPMISCNVGPPDGCLFPKVIGNVGMIGETEWPLINMGAYDGPLQNYRITAPGTVTPTGNSDPFTLLNVVPSDFFSHYYPAMNVASRPYYVQVSSMNFGTFSDYEYFVSPPLPNLDFLHCVPLYDLANDFVMCPGHVTGAINLIGPPDLYNNLPSGFRDLVLYGPSHVGDFAGSGELALGDHGLTYSSHVSASNPGGGGARVLFGGSATFGAGGSSFSGPYNLRLAAPATVASTWTANVLALVFQNTLTDPKQYLNESVQITDTAFGAQTVNCNDTINHDFTTCFGEALIKVVNNSPSVPFTGVSAAGQTQAGAVQSVSFSAGGKVSLSTPSANEGLIRLFLPRGTYDFQTTTTTAVGSHNQPALTLSIIPGWLVSTQPGAPDIYFGDNSCGSDQGPCINGSSLNLTATVTPVDATHNVTVGYTVNNSGGLPVQVYSGTAGTFSFSIPLVPCDNTIVITTTDTTTGISSTVTKLIYTPSSTPLTINGCQNITVTVPPGPPAYVNYNVSLSGGCPGATLVCNPPAPGPFQVGTTTVNCTAADVCSQTSCSFQVIVRTCPTIENDQINCLSPGHFNYSFDINNPPSGAPVAYIYLTPTSPGFTLPTGGFIVPPSGVIAPGSVDTITVLLTVALNSPAQLCFDVDLYDDMAHYICTRHHCIDNPALPKVTWDPLESTCRHASLSIL